MIEGMEKSGEEQFISRKPPGENDTYHLRAIEYLGYVERGKERFFIASAGFIRSSPFGRDTPPARGHSFMIVFRPDFTIAASSRVDISGCRMDGNRLIKGDEVVEDFDSRDIRVRHGGYAMLGGLPYFFSDKISDDQWQDDEFIEREAKAEEARKRKAEEEAQKR
ncbi:hypothetical protein OKA04_15950 [Luteolibacter flavescens]|uniref:Uncharacterized protein n=1 Tax=Luteolibacter flavescens TaxID=1859460 RepID=A0ABT3FRL0_9BACT|nr:hypothetical protein [Luteolibacter flavescens]MCW1886231.1 hypothetical protein [Luteolibacter flavescens]